MGTYLRVKAAGYTLLVDSGQVWDVMTNQDEEAVAGCPGHRAWRGQTLPIVDLPEALGGRAARRPIAVVIGEAGRGSLLLDVDGAGPMLRLDEAAFRRLPPLPSDP